MANKSPLSPSTPASPSFTNPFSPRSREVSEYFPRPGSGNRGDNRTLHHKSSTATYSTSTRERPITFSSGSPSLRSKRSDVSCPSTNNHPVQHIGYPVPGQHYTSVLPSDIPSPITSIGEYKGELIEGWTTAQGRSSTMSSPVQGRDSVSSQAQPSLNDSSSPPAPRETILDRAFQLRVIPGSDREVAGEEKLTSLARFDALMREVDEKRRQREAAEKARQSAIRSAFEADDSSDEAEGPTPADLEDTDSDDDNYVHEQDPRGPRPLIAPSAKRALEFIAGQDGPVRSPTSPRPAMSRTPLSFHADQMPTALMQAPPPARPHTSHAKTRAHPGQRTHSTSQAIMANRLSSQNMPALASKPSEDGTLRPSGDKRQSSSSTKRLSFTEFTKRLSSTSSLLLVQTNPSGGSSRGSSEVDLRPSSVPRPNLNPRGAGPPPRDRDRDDKEKACGWRGSVGVMGTEGGFL